MVIVHPLYVLEDDTSISNRSFMRSNNLRGLVHVRIKGGVGTLNMVKPSSDFYCPFQGSASFWILYVIYVSCLSCLFFAALLPPTGKGLTSWLSCVVCFPVLLSLSYRFLVSGVVLNCTDSWSSPSSLLCLNKTFFLKNKKYYKSKLLTPPIIILRPVLILSENGQCVLKKGILGYQRNNIRT